MKKNRSSRRKGKGFLAMPVKKKDRVVGKIVRVNSVRNYTCVDCNKVHAVFIDSRIKENGQELPKAFECKGCKGPAVYLGEQFDMHFPDKLLTEKGSIYYAHTSEGPVLREV